MKYLKNSKENLVCFLKERLGYINVEANEPGSVMIVTLLVAAGPPIGYV